MYSSEEEEEFSSIYVDFSTAHRLNSMVIDMNIDQDALTHKIFIGLPPLPTITQLCLDQVNASSAEILLRELASTLEELVWVMDGPSEDEFAYPVEFQKLRRLQLGGSPVEYICSVHAPLLEELALEESETFTHHDAHISWATNVQHSFVQLHTLHYEISSDSDSLSSLLAMCPNIVTLCLRNTHLFPSYDCPNKKCRGACTIRGGGGNHNSRCMTMDDYELFLALSGTSSTNPLPNLRRLFLDRAAYDGRVYWFTDESADIRLLLFCVQPRSALEIHVVDSLLPLEH